MSIIENISRAFKYKDFRDYFFWQFISFTGTWMQATAQSWLIYKLTGSALFLGLVSFAGSIPSLLFAPVSGIIADKFKRKKILITTQTICLIQGVVLISLYFSGIINKWHILFLAMLLGIANAFDVTARQSFIPLLIQKKDLLNAIALNASMFNAARILGPALAGLLIASHGEGICFVLNVFSYVPFIIFLLCMKPTGQEIRNNVDSPIAHFKEGLLFAWNTKAIRYLLILIGTVSFWGMSYVTLLPVFSDKLLHAGSKGFGILMGCSGTGAVIGGLFLASRKEILDASKLVSICSLLYPLCLYIFGFSTSIYLSSTMMLIIGFCTMIITSGSNTIMQSIAPDYLRGRIVGLYSTMFMGMFPLGSLVAGFLANKIGVSYGLTIGSTVCLLMGIFYNVKAKELKSH